MRPGALSRRDCADRVQNADETGVDCGGVDCGTCISCAASPGPNTCSPACRCPAGLGDCDADRECQPGLSCTSGISTQFGISNAFQVCAAPHCSNDVVDSASGEIGVDCGGPCGQCASVVCPGPAPKPGGVLQGSFTVANQIDVQTLDAFSEITGDLTIANGLTSVALVNLIRVGGAINVFNTTSLKELGLTALATVTGHITLARNQALEQVRLCSLRQAGGFFLNGNPEVTSIEFPKLENAQYFNFGGNAALTTVSAPLLVTAPISINGSPLMTSYNLPALRNARWIAVSNMPALTALNLSQLTSIEIGFRVKRTGIIVLEGNLSSPIDEVVVQENPALERLSFPNATRLFSLSTSNQNPKLALVDFRSVTSVGTLDVVTTTAGQVRLDALETADSVGIAQAASVTLTSLESTLFGVALSTRATALDLPELVNAGESFRIVQNPNLTVLTAPKLSTATTFNISSNPLLPTCRAQAILAQLTSAPALVTISGNDDAGTCN